MHEKFYPKLPTGPSSLGTAQVRALDARGGEYQNSWRDSSTRVLKQGEFSKVYTGGIQYVTSGGIASSTFKSVATSLYQIPFAQTQTPHGSTYIGNGLYSTRSAVDSFVAETTLYPADPAPFPINFTRRLYTLNYEMYISSYYGGFRSIGTFSEEQRVATAGLFGGVVVPSLVSNIVGPPVEKLMFRAATIWNGRVDAHGRKLGDILMTRWYTESASFGMVLNASSFTRPLAEFHPFTNVLSNKDMTLLLIAEEFFWYEWVDPGTDYVPKLWLAQFPNHDFDAGFISDITSLMFPDGAQPIPDTAGAPPEEFYGPGAGDNSYNTYLSFTMSLMRSVALPGNAALYFYRHRVTDPSSVTGVWRQRITRVSYGSGLTVSLVYDEPPDPVASYVQHAVHLGENWVLAKRVAGFGGTGFPVVFMLSTDGGENWTDMPPVGFNNTGLNQFFGEFTVHRARKDGEPGVVLLNSWDVGAAAYYVYESKDDGASWARKGRIAKPNVFRRIDYMLTGDGGGHFNELLPGPDPTRVVDRTIPDRYTP